MFKRRITDELIELTRYFPVVGVIGPRQVGKTTLVKSLSTDLEKDTIYLDLQSNEDFNKLSNAELYLKTLEDKTIIIDEIQLKPELFSLLRSLVDRKRVAGRFIILGSASPDLIRKSTESLAGRIVYKNLDPFDLIELPDKYSVNDLWLKGGFPDSLFQSNSEVSIIWMRSFIQTYIERDLPMLGLNAPLKLTENLWNMLAHLNGAMMNYSQLAKSLGIAVNTVKSYVGFFENSFLIRTVKPFYTNSKKRLVKTPKMFFRDTGILHHLLKIFSYDDLLGHPGVGSSWEAFVINQILVQLPLTHDAFFYRTQDGSELDLVITKGNKIKAGIEVKFSNEPKFSKGNTLAVETIGSENNYILTPSSDFYPVHEKVKVCSVEKFIFDILPEITK